MTSFNWVVERSKCSMERIMQTLGEVVDSDVKTANALNRRGVSFHFSTEASEKIIVARDRDLAGVNEIKSVVFELSANMITATAKSRIKQIEIFSAKPHVSEDGECLLLINEQPCKLWQASRKALEDLFFGF